VKLSSCIQLHAKYFQRVLIIFNTSRSAIADKLCCRVCKLWQKYKVWKACS